MAAQPRTTSGLSPGTDPVCLLITTVAVVIGLVTAGLASWPARPAAMASGARPASGTVPGQVPPARGQVSRAALRLLDGAAEASGAVSYRGVEMLAWWGPHATTATVADVWHRPGQEPDLRAVAPGLEWPSAARPPGLAAPVGRPMAAAPGLTQRLVSLLAGNYTLALGGSGTVAGRPAEVVAVRRPGGGLAARFWLDKATKLPLRRETYSPSGGLLSEEAFLSLTLRPGRQTAAPPEAQAWQDELSARRLAALRAGGWPLPGRLLGSLALVDARQSRGPYGRVVHLAYSDGLSAVSVFIQRGTLPPGLAGWLRTAVAGHPVYAGDPDDGSVAWSARGFVFTVIAQGPARTVSDVVGALPHDPSPRPGLLARMLVGAHRLLSWLGVRH